MSDTPTDVTASGVEALIARLRKRGVEAGQAERDEIVGAAEREADRIVTAARQQAGALLEEAAAKSERFRKSGEDALRVALRDTVLRLRETLRERLERQLRSLVKQELSDETFLRELIAEIVGSARSAANIRDDERMALQLPPTVIDLETLEADPAEQTSRLSQFAREIAGETLRDGIEMGTLEAGTHGLRIRLTDRDVEIDLTDTAIADLLLRHLQPRFRLVLQDIMW